MNTLHKNRAKLHEISANWETMQVTKKIQTDYILHQAHYRQTKVHFTITDTGKSPTEKLAWATT